MHGWVGNINMKYYYIHTKIRKKQRIALVTNFLFLLFSVYSINEISK